MTGQSNDMKTTNLYIVAALALTMISITPVSDVFAAKDTEDTTTVYDLKTLLATVVRHNPDISAAREAVHAAEHRISAAQGYPDPSLTFTYFPESIETRLGPQRGILHLVQTVPFPGKLSAKGDVSAVEARIVKERLKLTTLRIRRRVKEAYYSLIAVDRAIEILGQQDGLLEKFEQLVETRLEAGKAPQHDILKIQVERLKLQGKVLSYEERRSVLAASLNELLNRDPIDSIELEPAGRITEINLSLEELRRLALDQPELRLAKRVIDQRLQSVSLARKGYLPDFSVGMSYFVIGESPLDIPDSGDDAWNVSVGVKIPLWFGKVRGDVAAARSLVRHAEHKLESTRIRLLAAIESLYRQYRIARDMVALYRNDLLPRARRVLESAEAGYRTGEVDFLSVLDSNVLLLELQISYIEKTAELERKIAELEEATGSDIVPLE
jgi:cobalt-zinc-cadmium efflux system outer membrane protein